MTKQIASMLAEAEAMRKAGELEGSLALFRKLYLQVQTANVIAGMTYCYRKMGKYEEALLQCQIIKEKHMNSKWCKNEAVWSLIYGKLEKLPDDAPVEITCDTAEAIYSFGPLEILAKWKVVRKVLKSAKAHNRWDVIAGWIDNVTPEELSNEPMKDEKGREGWSQQSVWYNLKIRSLVESGNKEEAIRLARVASQKYLRQRKYFQRLEALATLRLNRLTEAEELYRPLCIGPKPDWWILQEYARVKRELGQNENALKILCKAALSSNKLESLVTLFQEIAVLCKILGKNEQCYCHSLLSKLIRQQKGWSVPPQIEQLLGEWSPPEVPGTLGKTLGICKAFWIQLNQTNETVARSVEKRKVKFGLKGRLSILRADSHFCFINTSNGESYFVYKKDVPVDVMDKSTVIFDARPSFDKKKNKESWTAINIRNA